MPTVNDILAVKGTALHSIEAGASVLEATRRMNQHKIGALVVTRGERFVGIFTERDVLRRVVAEQREPAEVTVGEVMTEDVVCCRPEMDVNEAGQIMSTRRVRHLPVCDDQGRLCGMISIGDVNACHVSNQEATIHFLSDYIYGRA